MTASLLPGRPVPIAVESPQEHVRNALMLLRGADVDAHGVRTLTAEEYSAICTRLQWAVDRIERRT